MSWWISNEQDTEWVVCTVSAMSETTDLSNWHIHVSQKLCVSSFAHRFTYIPWKIIFLANLIIKVHALLALAPHSPNHWDNLNGKFLPRYPTGNAQLVFQFRNTICARFRLHSTFGIFYTLPCNWTTLHRSCASTINIWDDIQIFFQVFYGTSSY